MLGGELGEVREQAHQQEHPNGEQKHTQEEDEPQRRTGRPLQSLGLSEVKTEDGHLLHKQQATQADHQDVLGYFVTSPHHVGAEARGSGLLFVQEQQGLDGGGGALNILAGGHGFVAGSRRVLQQGQEAPTAPPQQPDHPHPREVAQ